MLRKSLSYILIFFGKWEYRTKDSPNLTSEKWEYITQDSPNVTSRSTATDYQAEALLVVDVNSQYIKQHKFNYAKNYLDLT